MVYEYSDTCVYAVRKLHLLAIDVKLLKIMAFLVMVKNKEK